MSNILQDIPLKIIKEQELIIGPLAWELAGKVSGLTIEKQNGLAQVSGDFKMVVNNLVGEYERLFGLASHKVCHDAVVDIIKGMPIGEIPESIR